MVKRIRLVALCLLITSIAPLALAQVLTVTPSNPNGWVRTQNGTATGTFVTGPATPPLGVGSYQFSVGADGNSNAQLRNTSFGGVLLSSITAWTYSTYTQVDATPAPGPGNGDQAPYLIINVDNDGNGTTDNFLFFEPIYQNGSYVFVDPDPATAGNQGGLGFIAQPAPTVGAWQTWDVRHGGFWTGNDGFGGPPLRTLQDYIALFPNARIAVSTDPVFPFGIRIVAGGGAGAWDNYVGNVDAFSLTTGGTTTTYNFDPEPTVTIADVTQAEGTGGTTNFVFTLTLSSAVSQTVTIGYTTADGTALVADGDYVAQTGNAVFAPFATTTTITVPVTADSKLEPNETFFVNLTANPGANASVADNQAIGTITNDDAQPTITISDLTQAEGSTGGTTNFNFSVTLSNPSSLPITVDYATVAGTATAPADFANVAPTTITFTPGTLVQSATVAVVADTTFEPNETFTVNLSSPTNATIADGTAAGVITNDDPLPSLSINDVTAAEGDAGTTNFTFTITASNTTTTPITVNYATANGTATAGTDYTTTAGVATIPAGATTTTVVVPVIGDVILEPNETFTVNLTVPVGATVADAQGVGTITNDDGAADISITTTAVPIVGINSPVRYDVAVTNNGPVTATGVTVVGTVPAGFTNVSVTPSQGTCTGTTTITCSLGTLLNGATATIVITATSSPIAALATNTSTVSADQTDPNLTNNVATVITPVSTSIPTMSEWALMILAASLALYGAVVMKR